jgi:prepilin-type N-terminal cleavage/methylation domain
MKRMSDSRERGFSLIELLIVVLVIGLLAAIATTSYRRELRSGQRRAAETALLGLAQALERFRLQHASYAGAADPDGRPRLGVDRSPPSGPTAYDLRVVSASTVGYRLRALPAADGPNADDGFLQLDSNGRRACDRNGNGVIDADENGWP